MMAEDGPFEECAAGPIKHIASVNLSAAARIARMGPHAGRNADDEDAERFARALIRDNGRYAATIVWTRVRLLERENRRMAAGLWRRIAEKIEQLERDAVRNTRISSPR